MYKLDAIAREMLRRMSSFVMQAVLKSLDLPPYAGNKGAKYSMLQ